MPEHSTNGLTPGLPIFPFAHDLRQPLRIILLTAQKLNRRDDLPVEATQDLEKIVAAAARQDELLSAAVEYEGALAAAHHDSPMPLALAIQTACARMETWRELRGGAVCLPSTYPRCSVPSLTSKAVEKLLHNALKFHCPGSAPKVEVSLQLQDGEEVQIRVMDEGIGIQPQYAEKIFEPLSRLNPIANYPGAGLGLATCRAWLTGVGGMVHFEDRPGESGAAFVIRVRGTGL